MGFRTPTGVVTTTQSFRTMEIPRLVRGKPGAWDPLICLEWGNNFLCCLKERLQKDVANTAPHTNPPVWRVKFLPKVGIEVDVLDHAGVEDVRGNEHRVGFLPTWYWDEVRVKEGHMEQGTDCPQLR